jgi:hypothetical protein
MRFDRQELQSVICAFMAVRCGGAGHIRRPSAYNPIAGVLLHCPESPQWGQKQPLGDAPIIYAYVHVRHSQIAFPLVGSIPNKAIFR